MDKKCSISEDELDNLRQLMWPASNEAGSASDIQRWHRQGFSFNDDPTVNFGLKQQHGGPCGVLAPVQAYVIMYLLRDGYSVGSQHISDDVCANALARSLGTIIYESRENADAPSKVVLYTGPLDTFDVTSEAQYFDVIYSHSFDGLVQVIKSHVQQFCSLCGVCLFMFSVILTRGIERIKDDMDDRSSKLTGQHGHCSQELLNLLLAGEAVSNVFDGSVPMGDTGLTLRGISKQSCVGYLTHLEALRYCRVGNFYKSPKYPVWVVGSSSHFSVLFALNNVLSAESKAEELLANAQRYFRALDPQENGFIESTKLVDILRMLELGDDIIADEVALGNLHSKLEVTGAGIILWDDFWRHISVLLAERQDQVLSKQGSPVDKNFELAQKLQADFNAEAGLSAAEASSTMAAEGKLIARSDSDLARQLQAQFDAEGWDTPSSGYQLMTPPRTPPMSVSPLHSPMKKSESKQTVGDTATFELFHYNGLSGSGNRQPRLVKSVITKQFVNSVGFSVPMQDTSQSGGHGSPIEEVIRTKWPGALISWDGQSPPSLD